MNMESIKRRLLVKYPFFGSVVANSNFIAESSIETAGTDGKNIYYNPNFIESITYNQQIFVFAHEICHIAFNHIFRSEGKDKKLWNIATDAVINSLLKQDGLTMVKGVVDIQEAINYDSEEMYKKLLEEKNQQNNDEEENNNGQNEQESLNSIQESSNNQSKSQMNQNQESSNNSQQSSQNKSNEQSNSNSNSEQSSTSEEQNYDVGHDTHSMWDKAIEKKHQEDKFGSNKESEQDNKLNQEINKLAELGEKEAFKQNKIERKKQLEELRKSLASKSHGYGNNTNSEIRNITDIGLSEPLIDWIRLLKEAVKYDIDWSYQNAGIEDGVVTAYLEEFPKPETEIILDTSGSIDEILLRNFLRECKNILQASKVKVGCFDTKFYGFTEIKDASDIDSLPFYGGGGTNFDVAINSFTRRVENKIIFTDGEAPMPDTSLDVIWIVFGGAKINPKGGKVIYIDDEQLKRLCNYEIKGRFR